MAKGFFIRTPNGWEASGDESRELLKKFPIGSIHEIDCVLHVNSRFRAKYQMLYQTIFQNQDKYQTMSALKSDTRIQLGHYELTPNGNKVPISPTFERVDDDQLDKEYFQPLIDIGLELVVGATEEELRERIDSILSFAG